MDAAVLAGAPRGAARLDREAPGTPARLRHPRDPGARAGQSAPGITISELADHMNIKANYLYRVLPTLQSEGKVKKDGRGWKPA